jgi:hypothetical protein
MTETQATYEARRHCKNCGLRVDGICTLTKAEHIECLAGDERTHWRLKIKHDCHDCGNTVVNTMVCRLPSEKTDECLRDPTRPHWKLKEFINSETLHARTCRCDECIEYWKIQDGLQEAGREEDQNIDGDTIRKNNYPVQDLEMEKARMFTNQRNPDRNIHDPNAPIKGADEYIRSARIIEREQKQEPGKKNDHGKPRYDLLPCDVLEEITIIFTHGAEKYGEYNWTKGMSWSRLFAAAQRHQWSFWSGDDVDEESGRPHLTHAIVNLMFLLAYYKRGIGTKDRYSDRAEARCNDE